MMKKLSISLGIIAIAAVLAVVAFAAVGDLLLTVNEPEPMVSCCGIGVEYDGSKILYTHYTDNKIHFTNLSGADLGELVLKNPDGSSYTGDCCNAIALNFSDGFLYGGGWFSTNLYKVDMSTGVVTLVKANAVVGVPWVIGFVDGLAWDPRDNTFWMSDDVSCNVRHLDSSGNDIGGFDGCAVTGYWNSGLAVGLDGTLFYGTDGYGLIYALDTTTSPPTNLGVFASPGGRDEDMSCGPLVTKADGSIVETLLSQDAYDNWFVVIEMAEGKCVSPAPPAPPLPLPPPQLVPPPLGCPDLIIDADGFDSADDGIPGAVDVFDGAPLTDFAATVDWSGTGVDMFDNDGSGNWTEGDDLITEGSKFGGIRNKIYDAGFDQVILDKDGSLFDKQPVSFDLDGMGAMLRIRYYDADGNSTWDNGEDIVFDANDNYIYDEFCPPPPPPPELKVPVDIKPQSCPNPLNVKDKGVLPVAILGTVDRAKPVDDLAKAANFDVTQIDPASVKLEGVSPLRSALEDVATPFVPFLEPLPPPKPLFAAFFIDERQAADCTDAGADGNLDLTLKFDNQAIVAALGPVTDGEVRVLKLTGNLLDGMPIVGEDVVVILKKK